MIKNQAGQAVAFQMVSATDGSPVTSGTPTVHITGDNGTQAAGGGASVHKGNGQWTYAPSQAETNYDHVIYTMAITGAVSNGVQVYPQLATPKVNTVEWAGAVVNPLISGRVDAHTGNVPSVNVTNWVGVPTLPLVNQFVQCIVTDASQAGLAKWVTTDTGETSATAGSVAQLSQGAAGGLTEQQVRDAMKLAPTAGTPAPGSVDQHLDDIQGQTDLMGFTSGNIKSDAVMIDSSNDAAARLSPSARGLVTFTVGTGSTTSTIVLFASDPTMVDIDQFKGQTVKFNAETATPGLRGQGAVIQTGSVLGTLQLSAGALTQAPVSGDVGTIA